MRKCIRLTLLVGVLAAVGCARTKSTDELIGDLNSGQEGDRVKAVRLLPGHTEDADKVVPALIASLDDKDSHIRRSAAIGLGYFGEKARDAIPALKRAEKDVDARVREAAGVALSRIDPAQFQPPRMKRAQAGR
jgi:HEAT repeat protein